MVVRLACVHVVLFLRPQAAELDDDELEDGKADDDFDDDACEIGTKSANGDRLQRSR